LAAGTRVGSGGIDDISLLGSTEEIRWSRNTEALTIELPKTLPNDIALAFTITLKGEMEP
jgi:hypothetical protein